LNAVQIAEHLYGLQPIDLEDDEKFLTMEVEADAE
jgi:hypothetical protein